MNKKFLEKRLSEVVRTDAKIASKPDFLATHVPFDNLEYIASGRTEHDSFTIKEERFFKEQIINQRDYHNFLVVKGSTGSGKSHFIRWLKERYENDIDTSKEEIIFIERTQSTLKDALKQMSENKILKDSTGIDEIEKMIKASQNLESQGLKTQLALQLAYLAKDDKNKNIVLSERHRRNVYEFMTDSNVQDVLSKQDGPLDRIQTRLVPDEKQVRKDEIEPEFKPEDFVVEKSTLNEIRSSGINRRALRLLEDLNHRRKSDLKEDLANYLNSNLEEAIQNCVQLNSADLKVVFTELRRKLKKAKRNLTIFIEDITSFTGIGRGIVEVLITEHRDSEEEELCRLFSIVGITDGYYNTEFPDNIKDRVTGQVLLDDALFYEKNKEDKIIEIAGRYLNAINLEKDALVDWINNRGAAITALPISNRFFEHDWSLIELPEGKTISLFPFNKNALIKMFNGLKTCTPREFLKSIIKSVFKEFINSEDFPASPQDLAQGKFEVPRWEPLTHERIITEQFQDEADKVKSLILWWGQGNAIKEENKLGGLSSQVFASFGIDIAEVEGVKKDETIIKGKESDVVEVPSEEKFDRRKEYEEHRDDLNAWLNDKVSLHSYANLRDQMINFILEYVDWEFYDIPPYLVSTNFNSNTVGIEGQAGIISGQKIYEIARSEDAYYALAALLNWDYKGNKTWDFEDSTNNLIYLQLWIDKNIPDIIEGLKKSITIEGWHDKLFQWGLFSKYYLGILSGSIEKYDLDLKELYKLLLKDHAIDENKVSYKKHAPKTVEIYEKEILGRDFNLKLTNNNKIIKRYYNCHQGSITNASTTEVFVLDAEKILENIEHLKRLDWNLDNLNYFTDKVRDKSKQNKLWYSSLKLLEFLDNHLQTIITAESNHLKDILNKFDQYIPNKFKIESVDETFSKMDDFLSKLDEANEGYNSDDFRGFKHNYLTAQDFVRLANKINSYLNIKDPRERLVSIFSNESLINWKAYNNLFKSIDSLLERIIKRYQRNKEELSGGDENLESLIKDIKTQLEELQQKLKKIIGDDVYVS